MPIDPGTLAGYDQLLSISQEAVNRQLKVLYLTPAEPPILNGPQFLINHEMHFHKKRQIRGNTIVSRDGLDAYVCCPQVEFGGQSIVDQQDKYRTAVIRFKFRKAEEDELTEAQISAGQGDSVLVYEQLTDQDDDGNDIYAYPEIVINGWEISWEATIDKQDIQNVFEDIIKPANSTDSKMSLTGDLKESLKGVSSQNFQVSAIFCAMQSAQLLRSFELVDEHGNPPSTFRNRNGQVVEDSNIKDLIAELKYMLVSSFTQTSKTTGLGSTPDNPFVLGYTVSQKVPALEQVNPAAAKANVPTPKYFVPKTFRCNLSPTSSYSAGILNYCMLTHRAMDPPEFVYEGKTRVIDDGMDGAGGFPENVFARLKSKAVPGSTEGALFFCQDIFVNHWIGSFVAPLFYLSPQTVGPSVAEIIEAKYSQLNVKGRMYFGSDYKSPTRTISRNNVYRMTNSMRTARKIIAENGLDDPTESMKLYYDTTLEVKYENLHPLQDSDEDVKRRLKFTIGSYTKLNIRFFRRLVSQGHVKQAFEGIVSGIGEIFGDYAINRDVKADDQWEDTYDANIYLNYVYTFEVGTSPQNSGSFTVENPQSLHMKDNKLIAHSGAPTDSEGKSPGLWTHVVTFNWASALESFFDTEKGNLSTIGEELAKSGASLFTGAVDDLAKSLTTTVILPAGDVFMFKGMSCDDEHNVFTTISYNTATEGSVQAKVAKDVSQGTWQKPVKA